ncbi:Deleted in lung and esophageal cancer protein 1 [Dufourea novaeangliae]|uniref:Deleted in lung and esophageal cancer protein 1 n=1 Tax=Dufourea novaeangliae TaxID=178035 RepID=A0A154NYN5_DUFNO|nr:Deleted in lung and esophageal cancer protein 1 [Dufourea novaeangliae]
MASVFVIDNKNDENIDARNVEKRWQNTPRPKSYNWKMSYNVIKSGQQTIMLQQKSSFVICTYRNKLQNACPGDIKLLKECTGSAKEAKQELRIEDDDYEEHETKLDPSGSVLEPPKSKVWDEYKKLLQLERSTPKRQIDFTSLFTDITCLKRFCLDKSIIRIDVQKTILVADTNYVQFRNFKLNKLYKKTIRLQNVTTSPARFKFEGRPIRSKFQVLVEPVLANSAIIPPGMRLKLNVLFYCDVIEQPEEMLIVNVQNGKPLIIRLHGFKDAPILLDPPIENDSNDTTSIQRSLITSHPELDLQPVQTDVIFHDTWDSESPKRKSTTFDCKKCFVGEEVEVSIRFENIGGEGRFFLMSEIDWSSMYIEDVTDKNILTIPPFAIRPAYFELKPQEEIKLFMRFLPDSYGIHVDKLYILSDNCAMLASEMIGDGVFYEPSFVQIRTILSTSLLRNADDSASQPDSDYGPIGDIDKRTRYHVTLNASFPDGIGQCMIFVSNISEISMHFRWKKRKIRYDEDKEKSYNNMPLKYLRIDPVHGILSPTSVHYFNVTVECRDLHPNLYAAVLQLYVEDIPLAAISKKLELHTERCVNKRRKCLTSVDIMVADLVVWSQYTMDNKSKMCVMTDEMISHYDIVNFKQFEPLAWERIISTGIVRPTKTLHIGIEETFVLLVKNFSENSLAYSWGEANGSDKAMVKLCVCPENGVVGAKSTEEMKITLVPVKEGIVQYLHVPCFVGDSQRIVLLAIECSIDPLRVTFYLPLSNPEIFEWETNFTRIEWRVDSLRMALDTADLTKRGMKLLDRYKTRDERELMNTNLDQGDVLKDASAGPSVSDAEESGVESSLSTRTSEIIKMSDFATEELERTEDNISPGHVVPFHETTLPAPTQPVVIEFLGLSLQKAVKKTFVIKNETPIPTSFRIWMKNFYPIQCHCENQTRKDNIKLIYKQAFGHNKSIVEETLCRVKQPDAGVVIYVDPLSSDLDPFQAVSVDVYVFADTWGVYVDELDINITGLPRYTLAICVQVVDPPISLSIAQPNSTSLPVIKYGTEEIGNRLMSRKIYLKNTSVVPVAIDWHVFLIQPTRTQTLPFNVILDVCTPFTDALSKELRDSKHRSKSETHTEKHITVERKSKTTNSDDVIGINDSVADLLSNVTNTYSDTTLPSYLTLGTNSTWILNNKNSDKAKPSTVDVSSNVIWWTKDHHEYMEDDTRVDSHQTKTTEDLDIEFKISILPYYGEADKDFCTVTPTETFILPKSNETVNISICPDKCTNNGNFKGEFSCKVLGFLRIAPSDKYRDNQYSRPDGNYLHPIEFDVTATFVKPRLLFNISEADRTFTCCVNDVIQTKRKKLELKKTFFFYNNQTNVIKVVMETYNPFHIKSTSIYVEKDPCKPTVGMCVNGHGCAEVEIVCTVNEELINTILHTSKTEEFRNSIITLRESLVIIYSDKGNQEVELILDIWLPLLKLSSYTLDFGLVYIGDTKKLTLLIKNLSICTHTFKIERKFKNEDFAIDHEEGKLLRTNISGSCFTLTISFQPKKPGQSVETLEIITDIPYNVEECEISGEGTLDEKYHNPGV